jgi:predicted RNase H-like nuclease (RuvC/YqgF family)
VEEVVGENVSLKRENSLLKEELEGLKKTIALQKNALAELKEENKLIKLAKEMSMSGSDVHDLKIKINELVRDIDRCIDLLNE